MLYGSGKSQFLNRITESGLLLHLYKNNIDLKNVKEVYDFPSKPLYGMFWDIEKNIAYLEEEIVFDTPVGKVYGYFITDSNILLWAEQFKDAPLDISIGAKIKFNIRIVVKERNTNN